MKTKTWLILIAALLAGCLALSVYILWPREASTHAQITSRSEVIRTVDLRIDQELTITTPNGGENTVTVRDGKIAVTAANCPDHYCMQRGYCNSGTQIVCLPNQLVIRFLGAQSIDAMVG